MWIGSNTEIHEQKKMAETLRPREEALRESEAYLRDAFGNQPFDIELYGQLCDRLRRYLQRFGLKRVARDTSATIPCHASQAARREMSICSAIARASSTSMLRYLTVPSIIVWPSRSCTACQDKRSSID